ncbi:MAG: hypothetical protein Q7R91_01385 [bacterium]|nr:hypothetical protein [bacterium]
MSRKGDSMYGVHFCGCEMRCGIEKSKPEFCADPKHRSWNCGCYNVGGKLVLCDRHYNYRVFEVIGLLLTMLAAYVAFHVIKIV